MNLSDVIRLKSPFAQLGIAFLSIHLLLWPLILIFAVSSVIGDASSASLTRVSGYWIILFWPFAFMIAGIVVFVGRRARENHIITIIVWSVFAVGIAGDALFFLSPVSPKASMTTQGEYDRDDQRLLMELISTGNIDAIKRHANGLDSLNFSSQMGHHPLLEALSTRNPEVFQLLLELGVDPNRIDFLSRSVPAQILRRNLNSKWIEALLNAGLDPNLVVDKTPLVFFAVGGRSVTHLKTLLDGGASIDSRNVSGESLFQCAVDWQAWRCADYLMDQFSVEDYLDVIVIIDNQEKVLSQTERSTSERQKFIARLRSKVK